MKTPTSALLFLSLLTSTILATPVTPLHSRYTHIQLTQRQTSNSTIPSAPSAGSTVTIQPGDTLTSIAAAAGVGICDIVKENGISNPDVIVAGEELKIPAATGAKDDTSCLGGART